MYTILPPDNGQSNGPKHVAEIQRMYYILIGCVFYEHTNLFKNLLSFPNIFLLRFPRSLSVYAALTVPPDRSLFLILIT
jgi:hypothetical protein